MVIDARAGFHNQPIYLIIIPVSEIFSHMVAGFVVDSAASESASKSASIPADISMGRWAGMRPTPSSAKNWKRQGRFKVAPDCPRCDGWNGRYGHIRERVKNGDKPAPKGTVGHVIEGVT